MDRHISNLESPLTITRERSKAKITTVDRVYRFEKGRLLIVFAQSSVSELFIAVIYTSLKTFYRQNSRNYIVNLRNKNQLSTKTLELTTKKM